MSEGTNAITANEVALRLLQVVMQHDGNIFSGSKDRKAVILELFAECKKAAAARS